MVKNNDFNSDHDIWKCLKFNYWFHLVDYYLCGKFFEEKVNPISALPKIRIGYTKSERFSGAGS